MMPGCAITFPNGVTSTDDVFGRRRTHAGLQQPHHRHLLQSSPRTHLLDQLAPSHLRGQLHSRPVHTIDHQLCSTRTATPPAELITLTINTGRSRSLMSNVSTTGSLVMVSKFVQIGATAT